MVITAFWGAVMPLGMVWNIANSFNVLMAILNLYLCCSVKWVGYKRNNYYPYKVDKTPIATLSSSSTLVETI
jgi:Na+/alanine symporter